MVGLEKCTSYFYLEFPNINRIVYILTNIYYWIHYSLYYLITFYKDTNALFIFTVMKL